MDPYPAWLARALEPPEIPSMEHLHPVEIEALRLMSPAEKLAVMTSLIREAYRLKAAWIRHTNPHLSEEEVQARLRELMSGDRS